VQVTLVDRRIIICFSRCSIKSQRSSEPERHRHPDPAHPASPKERRGLAGEARGVDSKEAALLDEGELAYDKLVIATGARHSYFGHSEWMASGPGLKSIGDALETVAVCSRRRSRPSAS